jgi:hypothetical protein
VRDVWEDGVALTSGRSGLASAVIYQPSCPQSYSQDCIANLTSNREYDDDRKPPDGHDDSDISSRGAGPSYHLNCSTNFFSSGRSGGQYEAGTSNCEKLKKKIACEMYHMMREMRAKLDEHCSKNNISEENKIQLKQQLNDDHIVKLAKFHMKCNKHPTCPLQALKRRFRYFIFSRKDRSSSK